MGSPDEGAARVERAEEVRSLDRELRDEQRLLYVSALAWLLFWGLDVLSGLKPTWDTLALRGLWAGLTVAMGVGLGHIRSVRREPLRIVVGVLLPNLFLPLITWRLGGSSSHMFSWLCVLPAVALLVGGGVRNGLASTFLMLCAAGTMLWGEGASASRIAASLVMLAIQAVGIQFTFFYQRLLLERSRSEAEQRLARESLRESNERAVRAERLRPGGGGGGGGAGGGRSGARGAQSLGLCAGQPALPPGGVDAGLGLWRGHRCVRGAPGVDAGRGAHPSDREGSHGALSRRGSPGSGGAVRPGAGHRHERAAGVGAAQVARDAGGGGAGHARGARRASPPGPGAAQPAAQRGGRHRGREGARWAGGAAGADGSGAGAAPGGGQRAGHPGRAPVQAVHHVLHHEGAGEGHGAGARPVPAVRGVLRRHAARGES